MAVDVRRAGGDGLARPDRVQPAHLLLQPGQPLGHHRRADALVVAVVAEVELVIVASLGVSAGRKKSVRFKYKNPGKIIGGGEGRGGDFRAPGLKVLCGSKNSPGRENILGRKERIG